jgi:dipeptidyl aminopeptidase/acylaminoacyl peptidase
MPSRSPLNLNQLVRVPNVWDYDLAPDGRSAAVVWDKPGTREIFLAPIASLGRARRLTRTGQGCAAPRFSPNGRYLAFAQDYDGDERYDLFVHDFQTRQTRNVTPDTPTETINAAINWSPDSSALTYVSDRAGQFATYVLDLSGSAIPRQVTHHAYSDFGARFSPDGRYLAVNTSVSGQDAWLLLLPQGEQPGESITVGGPDGPIDVHYFDWSADSRRLAVASNTPGITTILVFDVETRVLTRVTPPTHEAGEPAWSPDGHWLAYTWNVDGNTGVRLHHVASGAVHDLSAGAGVHSHPQFSGDGRTVVALFNGARHPSDLWAFDLNRGGRGGKPAAAGTHRPHARLVTASRPPRLDPQALSEPEIARWASDEWTISGLLFRPRGLRRRRPGAGKAPAVLWVHGGPTWQFKNEWWVGVQYLVSHGCVVLAPNFRGSTGYGRAFQEANRFDLGGGDMRDVIAGAAFLAREGYADPRRIGITGASYGGYLTMTALTRHPQVFAAGAAVVPFLNWFTEHANERADLQYWDEQNFGDPVKNADRYREFSPIYYMENVVAPVLMLAGCNDSRCPADETEQAAAVLKEMGVPHEIVIYPDEGHFFLKPANRLDAMRRRTEFLLNHLGL